ncbi:MAG: hypothetical protein AB7P12_13390 [Alphaproteobacteria bacterium]
MAAPSNDHVSLDLFGESITLDFAEVEPPIVDALAASADLPEASFADAGPVALSLADLVPDAEGEVVFFDESGLTEMAVIPDGQLLDQGIADPHVTVGGIDVAGMAFYSFDSGVTLYLPADIHVSVVPG